MLVLIPCNNCIVIDCNYYCNLKVIKVWIHARENDRIFAITANFIVLWIFFLCPLPPCLIKAVKKYCLIYFRRNSITHIKSPLKVNLDYNAANRRTSDSSRNSLGIFLSYRQVKLPQLHGAKLFFLWKNTYNTIIVRFAGLQRFSSFHK